MRMINKYGSLSSTLLPQTHRHRTGQEFSFTSTETVQEICGVGFCVSRVTSRDITWYPACSTWRHFHNGIEKAKRLLEKKISTHRNFTVPSSVKPSQPSWAVTVTVKISVVKVKIRPANKRATWNWRTQGNHNHYSWQKKSDRNLCSFAPQDKERLHVESFVW